MNGDELLFSDNLSEEELERLLAELEKEDSVDNTQGTDKQGQQTDHTKDRERPSATQPLTKKVVEPNSKPINRSDDWVNQLLDDDESKDDRIGDIQNKEELALKEDAGLDLSDFNLETDFDLGATDITNQNKESTTNENASLDNGLTALNLDDEWDSFEVPEVVQEPELLEESVVITGNVLKTETDLADNNLQSNNLQDNHPQSNNLEGENLQGTELDVVFDTELTDTNEVERSSPSISITVGKPQKESEFPMVDTVNNDTQEQTIQVQGQAIHEQADITENANKTDQISRTKISPNLDKFINNDIKVTDAKVEIVQKSAVVEEHQSADLVKDKLAERRQQDNDSNLPIIHPNVKKNTDKLEYLKESHELQDAVDHIQGQIKIIKKQLRAIKDNLYDLTDASADMISQTRHLQKRCKDDFSVSYEQMHQLREQIIQTRKDIGDLPSKLDLVEEAMETDLYTAETRNL